MPASSPDLAYTPAHVPARPDRHPPTVPGRADAVHARPHRATRRVARWVRHGHGGPRHERGPRRRAGGHGRPRAGSPARHPGADQGPRSSRGVPALAGLARRRRYRGVQRHVHRPRARRRRHHRRQDQHARARPQRHHREPGDRAGAQPLGPSAHARRLQRGRGGRGGRRHHRDRAGLGRRRLDPHPRLAVRHLRHQGHAGPRAAQARGRALLQRLQQLLGRADDLGRP